MNANAKQNSKPARKPTKRAKRNDFQASHHDELDTTDTVISTGLVRPRRARPPAQRSLPAPHTDHTTTEFVFDETMALFAGDAIISTAVESATASGGAPSSKGRAKGAARGEALDLQFAAVRRQFVGFRWWISIC